MNAIEKEMSKRKEVRCMDTIQADKDSLLFMRNNVIINVRLKSADKAKETIEERLAKFIAEKSCRAKM